MSNEYDEIEEIREGIQTIRDRLDEYGNDELEINPILDIIDTLLTNLEEKK